MSDEGVSIAVNPYLNGIDAARMKKARVGIAGAGGLGSNVAQHLVRSGIGSLVICDFDVVTRSNLNRQFYFADQIGMKKTAALAENLLRISGETVLDMRDVRIDETNAAGIFRECDIVVEAFDSAAAKAMLVSALAPTGVKIVAASGIAGVGASGRISMRRIGANVYMAGDAERGVSSDEPPLSPRVGIAAAMEANTVLAILLGKEI
ncbi:MAG: sulfur carrier protein ThiS adenylyltransferase ThiF [Kiritimatiellae bacterium]|nr:sulfur carrier protein ThiS adenylyltransferase ThiF [Kiritimatiellia bacterium]